MATNVLCSDVKWLCFLLDSLIFPKVGHVILEGKPHLIVVSITPLGKGAEVTLAFEFPFQDYRRQLECACAQENCEVLKHNRMIQRVEQANGYRSSKDELGCLDSSQSNHVSVYLICWGVGEGCYFICAWRVFWTSAKAIFEDWTLYSDVSLTLAFT